MRPIPPHVRIPAPVYHNGPLPHGVTCAVAQWCARAEIPFRVTGGPIRKARLCPDLPTHAWTVTETEGLVYLVAGPCLPESPNPTIEALRVLEVLAHGFHDYGARESVCQKGLFAVD